MIEIDTLVGGKDHDLLDRDAQQEWLRRVESGEFHITIFAPPCGSFSRSSYANNLKPQPVRSREHPWGYPWNHGGDRKRAEKGNEFVLFALRGIRAAQQAKRRGHWVRSFLEHPEDLGRTPRGTPASIWQFEDTRKAFGEFKAMTAAGHQCQFGVD